MRGEFAKKIHCARAQSPKIRLVLNRRKQAATCAPTDTPLCKEMKVENIVRKLSCSPHEFIEIYQEGKALVRVVCLLCVFFAYVRQTEHIPADNIAKSQEGEWDGEERIIKFVSAAYAPENLLKIIGCKSQQLKEQQELRITEGLLSF